MKTPHYHRFSFVNSFDSSSLKLRIEAMNRPRKGWTMLKYPLALLLTASVTMAFVTKEQVTKMLPKTLPKPVVSEKPEITNQPLSKTEKETPPKWLSRYALLKNGMIHFVITPKMNLIELGELQQILSKHTFDKLLVGSVDYDVTNTFIKAIDFKFAKAKNNTKLYGTNEDDMIESLCFEVTTKEAKPFSPNDTTVAYTFEKDVLPELSKIITEDIQFVQSFISKNKSTYNLVNAEKMIFDQLSRNHLTMSFDSKAGRAFTKKQRKIGDTEDFYLQRGDLLPSMYHNSNVTYLSTNSEKALTDEELSKIKISDIGEVKIYSKDIGENRKDGLFKVFILIALKKS
jgi:hypothetical protein